MPGPGDTVVVSVGLAVHSLRSSNLPCVNADSTLAISLAKGTAKGATGDNGAESNVTGGIGAVASFLGRPRGMIRFEIYFKYTRVKKKASEEQQVLTGQRPTTLTPAPLAGTLSRRHIHTHPVLFISCPRHCHHLCIPDTVPQAAKSRSLLAAAMTKYKYNMATTITAQYIPIMVNKRRLTSR